MFFAFVALVGYYYVAAPWEETGGRALPSRSCGTREATTRSSRVDWWRTTGGPGTADGFGGRVITGVAHDDAHSRLTPVALAAPAPLVVDFHLEWTVGARYIGALAG